MGRGVSRMRAIARRSAFVATCAVLFALAPVATAHIEVASAAPTELLICVGTQGNVIVVSSFSQCNKQQKRFTIPLTTGGAAGVTGATGAAGARGPAGPTGPQGATGPT